MIELIKELKRIEAKGILLLGLAIGFVIGYFVALSLVLGYI